MLTLALLILPILLGVLTLLTTERLSKIVALAGSLAVLALACLAWAQFDPAAGMQFVFSYPWIASVGVSFAGGIDGISLLLVLLTAFLTPLIILSTFGYSYANTRAFYALILFMEGGLPTSFCFTFSSRQHLSRCIFCLHFGGVKIA